MSLIATLNRRIVTIWFESCNYWGVSISGKDKLSKVHIVCVQESTLHESRIRIFPSCQLPGRQWGQIVTWTSLSACPAETGTWPMEQTFLILDFKSQWETCTNSELKTLICKLRNSMMLNKQLKVDNYITRNSPRVQHKWKSTWKVRTQQEIL